MCLLCKFFIIMIDRFRNSGRYCKKWRKGVAYGSIHVEVSHLEIGMLVWTWFLTPRPLGSPSCSCVILFSFSAVIVPHAQTVSWIVFYVGPNNFAFTKFLCSAEMLNLCCHVRTKSRCLFVEWNFYRCLANVNDIYYRISSICGIIL